MALKDNWLERQITTVKELLSEGSELIRENKLVEATKRIKEASVIIDSAEVIDHRVLQLRSNAYNDLALIASRTKDPGGAVRYHRLALKARQDLNGLVDQDLSPAVAASHLNIGSLLAATGQFDAAEGDLRAALELLDTAQQNLDALKDVEPDEDAPEPLITADVPDDSVSLMRLGGLQNLGIVLASTQRFDEGITILKEAIALGDALVEGNHPEVRPALSQILMNAAVAQHASGDVSGSVETGDRAAAVALELYEESDNQDQNMLQQFVACQMNLVTFNEAAKQFDKAEDALFKVLDILPAHPEVVRRGVAFYESILKLDDDALEDGGLPREEAEESFEELKEMQNG